MEKIISHYQILSKIASGGMANVFLAFDPKTNTKVAVKVLKEEVSDKEKILERFTQEGLLNLDHPNIVKIFDAGVHKNTPYIVMEYIEGRDLEDLIKSRNKLTLNEASSIFGQLLSALDYVHSKGIIHRDIKPKNILIDKSGKVKLTDFGIAKAQSSHVQTLIGAYIGAPAYSSPEQMDSKPVDNRSDIYSLGVTFYQMLAGNTPFGSASMEAIIKTKFIGRPIPITNYRSDIPGHIVSIINKCMARNPDDRFGSVNEIITALSKYEDNGTVVIVAASNPTGYVKKYGFIFLIAAVIMLAAIIVLVVSLVNKNNELSKVASAITATASLSETEEETTSNAIETNALAAATKSKIAFNSDRDGNYKIYTMNTDGTEQIRLTNNPANDWYPSFSPDGSKIVFCSDRDGNNKIYMMNADGTGEVRLTNKTTDDWYPFFSPDGSKIVFMSDRDENNEIYIMNTDGSGQVNLTNNEAYDGVPSFSPDGSKIAFNSDRNENSEIYLMNIDGTGQINLTNNPAFDGGPSFSPDGSKIAFNSDRDGNNEIYIMNADGSGQTRLTNNPAVDAYPSFSPDGSKIAFTSDRDGGNRIFEIYIMNIDGSGQIRLTTNPANDWFPSFSPIPKTTSAGTASVETIARSAVKKEGYSIGDTGPAGGLIFYINPNYETDGWRYLEAAPANTELKDIRWSNVKDIAAGAPDTSVGTGKTNTISIASQSGHTASAARQCSDLSVGYYADWFLPSKDELDLMYKNLYLNGLGGFSGTYWSSSELGSNGAWGQNFNNGGQGSGAKNYGYLSARAVRAF